MAYVLLSSLYIEVFSVEEAKDREFGGMAPDSRGNLYPRILAADLQKSDPYFRHQILIPDFHALD
jgi:hypothetical protein